MKRSFVPSGAGTSLHIGFAFFGLCALLGLASCAGGAAGVRTMDRGSSSQGAKVTSEDVSTDAPAQTKSESAPARRGPGGLLLAYEITGNTEMIPAGGCRLKLENVRTHKDVFIPLKKDQTALFKELEPGRYFGTRLSCSTTRIWNLDNLFGQGFDVEAGRVSYVGKVIFDFGKTDMNGFRQAPRLDSQRALMETQTIVPAWGSGQIISGYTMKPITSAVIESEGPEAFDVFAKGTSEPEKTLEELMTKLKRCGLMVAKEDPLRIGHLSYIATYKSGGFAAIKDRTETHAFSEGFMTCVDNSLRAFKPPVTTELEVRVAY